MVEREGRKKGKGRGGERRGKGGMEGVGKKRRKGMSVSEGETVEGSDGREERKGR